MQVLTDEVTKIVTEVIVVLLGAFGSLLLAKGKHYLNGLKEKDKLGIIDKVTDAVVKYAEAELTGAKGTEKRDFAVKKAVSILASKGINVSEDEVIAGIEDGVLKLKDQQSFLNRFSTTKATIEQPVQEVAVALQPEVVAQPEQPASEPVSK